MDRENFERIGKALTVLAEDVRWLLVGHLIPAMQEAGYFLSRVLTVVVDSFSERDHSYKSEFVSGSDVLSTSYQGFVIDGRRRISSEAALMHLIVTGQSGSGKSTVCVIPNILELKTSKIIIDPSGELFLNSAGDQYNQGYDVKVVHFGNADISEGYNPFERIQNSSDVSKVASMLVRSILKNPADPFWSISATSLLVLIMKALMFEPKEYRHFANVRHLLQLLSADPNVVDRLVAKTLDVQLINEYKSFIAQDVKLKQSVIATCLAATSIFADPCVAKICSKDTLDIENFRKRPTALYIQCPTADAKFYSDLIAILFEQLAKVVMDRIPSKNELIISFILDEFPSLFIPNISLIISNIRKHRASLMLICQDISQITDIYGKQQSTAIVANCYSKIFFSGVSHDTAVSLSAQLGRYEYQDDKGRHVRELLTPTEVRTLARDKAIFLHGNSQPIMLTTTPVYKHPYLKRRTQILVPVLKGPLSGHQISFTE